METVFINWNVSCFKVTVVLLINVPAFHSLLSHRLLHRAIRTLLLGGGRRHLPPPLPLPLRRGPRAPPCGAGREGVGREPGAAPLRSARRVLTAGLETRYLAAPPGGRRVFPPLRAPGRAGPWGRQAAGGRPPRYHNRGTLCLRRRGTRRRAGPGPRYNRDYKGGANAAPPRAAGPGRRYQLPARAARPRRAPGGTGRGNQRSPSQPRQRPDSRPWPTA